MNRKRKLKNHFNFARTKRLALINSRMSRCYGCQKDLTKARKKYAWLLKLGYNPKDASSKILRNPDDSLPARQCCIVGLQTNIDPIDAKAYHEEIKKKIAADKMAQLGSTGERKRKLFKLFVTDDRKENSGEFVILDGPFNDIQYLTQDKSDPEHRGYEITNITLIPETLSAEREWERVDSLILWAGNISIVPVIYVNGIQVVGRIIWQDEESGEQGLLSYEDTSFLNCRVVEYELRDVALNSRVPGTKLQQPVKCLVVEKVFEEENYYAKQ